MTEASETDAPVAADTPAAAPEAATEEDARPGAEEVRSWSGHQVDDMSAAVIGKVDGFLVDAQTGRPEWLVVRTGRLGARSLVPARHAVSAGGRVWVPFTRDEIRSVPRGDGSKGLAHDDEQRLLEHYGIGAEAGRAIEIASREDRAVTSQPPG
jgi:hypothetical protein